MLIILLLGTIAAGRATTNDELENMLESGNPAIFTQGVSGQNYIIFLLHFIIFIIST